VTDPPDWDELSFGYTPTDWIYRAEGDTEREPVWDEGRYLPLGEVSFSPAAAVLSYGCGVFEGLAAERGVDGRPRLFRPSDNAARFSASAKRLAMPPFPEGRFVDAVAGLVQRSSRFLPPAGKGAFYVRPMMHGVEPILGLRRVRRLAVTIYGSPVGPYFTEKAGVRLKALPWPRTPPGGTGRAKAIGNYAGTVLLREEAQREGFDDVLFLDAGGEGLVSETAGSNVFCLLDDGELVTPPLGDTILPGITRDSVIRIARELEGTTVSERPLPLEEVLDRGRELFCTGTAWRLRPVVSIGGEAGERDFEPPALAPRLRATLRGIQRGARPDPFGWTLEVPEVDQHY
jgi:branched-chain amino acid aminotransferase